MSKCQKDVKLSKVVKCQKVKLLNYGGPPKKKKKKKLDTKRYTHNEVNFDVTNKVVEICQNISMNILRDKTTKYAKQY